MKKLKIKNQTNRLRFVTYFCRLFCTFTFLFLIINISSAYAWKVPIEVATSADNGEKIYSRLVAGIESGATDGFDNLWDAHALTTSPDPEKEPVLRAYFSPALWKDIRGPVKKGNQWDLIIDSVPEGKDVVVSWIKPQGMLKTGERLVLRDNDKVSIDGVPVETDIIQASNYVFVSDGEGPRSLSLVLSGGTTESSSSGDDSGFGCGTVKLDDNTPPNGGTSALGIVVLLLPLVFFRLRSAISRH